MARVWRIELLYAVLLCCVPSWVRPCGAQRWKELNPQVHGFGTQGMLYTTKNNLFDANTSDGSPAWTEAVVNVSAQATSKLHLAVQARYSLLGGYGNNVKLDWAAADYKVSDPLGFRFGKVKTPIGLFNELQDIDPSYLWALLPQSLYPITSRDSFLAHKGGVVYGTLPLGERAGKLQYRGWAGQGTYNDKDGYFIAQSEAGYHLPHNISGPEYGAALRWVTPLRGLMVGASELKKNSWTATLTADSPAESGTERIGAESQPNYFAMYERSKLMVAVEYSRSWENAMFELPSAADSPGRNDDRGWYAMASYKVSAKGTVGVYHTQNSDRQAELGPDRYQREWVFAGRYDMTPFLYAKAEQHFIRGTGLGYESNRNPELQPNTQLTVVKVGVSF